MIYFLFFLIGLGAVAYVGAPFRKRQAAHEYSSEARRDSEDGRTLGERRDNLLRQLKELEFDRSMGKTEGEEYSLLREELSQETAVVLQQLEAHEPASRNFPSGALPSDSSLSTHVAKQEADERDGFKNVAPLPGAELDIEAEVLIARARLKRRAHNRAVATKNATATNATATNATATNATATNAASVRGDAEAAAFCTSCGHRLGAEDCFCARCGQRRASVSSTVVASATAASGSGT